MTVHADYRTTTAATAEGLDRSTEIAFAPPRLSRDHVCSGSAQRLHAPDSETLIPAIDKVVDRNFGIVLNVIEWQHELATAALGRLGSLGSN